MVGDSARVEIFETEPFDALAGERKFVTVMFVDIAQSGRVVAGQDPEEADDRILPVLQVMIEAVQRFGGTVNQVLGDGLMAIFGAPVAQENHALRACLAADAIRLRVEELRAGVPSGGQKPLGLRMGLSSGEVVVREASADFGQRYRVLGEAVYLAQRLESAAPINRALASAETLRLVSGAISAQPHGQVRIGQSTEAVPAFLLDEINLDDSRSGRGAPDEPYFIGRNRDLETLERAWHEVAIGVGRGLAVTGEAGIGKSRLINEFLALGLVSARSVITCEILPPDLGRPLQASTKIINTLLSRQFGLKEPFDARSIRRLYERLGLEGRYAVAATLEVLGCSEREQTWIDLEPPERLELVVETVSQLVAAACRVQPLIMIFEDFHWADSETLSLAGELARNLQENPLLLVLSSRESRGGIWSRWPETQEIEVQPFSRTQSSALLEILLGSDPALDELKDLLATKTQGNPFFLNECVRALEDAGSLIRRSRGHELVVPISALKIPGTVSGVLGARIDALPSDERSVLVAASVIGPRVDIGLVRALWNRPKEKILASLTRLQRAGFLERTRIVPSLEYSFRHALIHEVAYQTVLKSKRRELHARVLEAIETRSEKQLPGKIDLLAHHAFRAERWAKAFIYCRKAGQRAQSRSANREAAVVFERALEAREQLPNTRRMVAREIDTRLEFVLTLFTLGEQDRASRHLVRAQALAEETKDQVRQTKVASAFSLFHWVKADLEGAIAKGEQALGLSRQLKDVSSQIELGTRLGSVYLDRGDYRAACRLLKSTIQKIPNRGVHDRYGLLGIASVGSRSSLARALGELGQFDEAIRIGDEGIVIAEEAGHVFSQVYAYLFVGNALLRKGDFTRSLSPLERSFELCNTFRAKLLFPLSAATLGYVRVRLGETEAGLALLRRAAAAAERQAIKFQLSQQLTWLGEALLLAGHHEEARLNAKCALQSARRHGEIGDEAWAHWLLGEIFASKGMFDEQLAEKAYLKGQEIAQSQRMLPLAAHIHYGLARLRLQQGSWDSAHSHLQAARETYSELEMGYWQSLVLRDLANNQDTWLVPAGHSQMDSW